MTNLTNFGRNLRLRCRRLRWAAIAVPCALVAAVALFVVFRPFRPKTPGRIRFALCQYESRTGDVRWSFEQAMRFAREAADHKADVVVLPEFSFSSTLDVAQGKARFNLLKRGYTRRGIRHFVRSRRCHLIVNHHDGFRQGTNVVSYNETLVFTPSGHVMTNYRKRLLSSMDTSFLFTAGDRPVLAEFPFGRVGLMICKDSSSPMRFTLYREADLVLIQFANIGRWTEEIGPLGNAFPAKKLKEDFDKIGQQCAEKLLHPVLMVNKTGLENKYFYIGGSRAIAADGTLVGSLDSGNGILYVDFRLGRDGRILPDPPEIPDFSKGKTGTRPKRQ